MNNGKISQEIEILRDFLSQEGSVGIVVGEHQTLDTMAAALSLYLSLTESGKQVQIISKKDPIVEISNLVGIDRVGKQFKGSTTQLVVSLPYSQGEIGKVSFKEEQGRINFNLTAAEGRSITPFETNDIKLFWQGVAPEFVIAVGVSHVEELEGFAGTITKLVNIDNFHSNSRLGDAVLVDEEFSSLSEVAVKVIKDLSLPLDVDTAQNLMDGVSYATRNFTKPETSSLAFEAAGILLAAGAVRKVEAQRPPRIDRAEPSQSQEQHRETSASASDRPNRDSQQAKSNLSGQQNARPQQDRGGRDNRNRGNSAGQDRFASDRQSGDVQNRDSQNQQRFQSNRNQNPVQQRSQHMSPTAPQVREEVITPQPEDVIEQPQMHSAPNVQQDYPQPRPQNMSEENMQQAPQEEAPTDIPNDWLVPKVFKGSKTQGDN